MSHSVDHNSTVNNNNQHGSKGLEVFVGGLARSLTEDKVRKVFSACGEITDIRLIKDQTGNLKGFGFIHFATKDAADKALKELNGSMVKNNLSTLIVNTLYKGQPK
ncbi:glycine-rich RNA-binding protein 4, mitochondrial-like [Bidens hawaiensis]|uniref:glycine-rich RNA-binding protein 4, mitochondrial-like n=1 Tax=Bidens hawaiensis TaxID=980011 RepID=UPI00404A3336